MGRRAEDIAAILTDGLNLLAGFAAPHMIQRLWTGDGHSLKEHAKTHLERLVEILPDLASADPPAPAELGPRLETFGYALDAWNGIGAPPHDVIHAARATLAALGLPEPEGGWDRWEPPE